MLLFGKLAWSDFVKRFRARKQRLPPVFGIPILSRFTKLGKTTGIGVHLLTIPGFKELAVLETASNMGIIRLGESADGLKLVAVRADGEVNLWNLPLIAGGGCMAWDWTGTNPFLFRLAP